MRQEFRTPLEILAANPDLFRLALRVRHHPASPLGDSSRRFSGNTRSDLVEELVARGYPHDGPEERRRVEMIADVHIAATEVLALGYLSGRYPDLDEVVDMLVLVTRGTRLAKAWRGGAAAVEPAANATRRQRRFQSFRPEKLHVARQSEWIFARSHVVGAPLAGGRRKVIDRWRYIQLGTELALAPPSMTRLVVRRLV